LQTKFLIAVVDDDESVREAMKGLLASHGYGALVFDRAEAFLDSDHLRSTACLIADVQMPGMTGPELHNRLIASGDAVPTIFITAYPDPIARMRALQNGAIDYFAKPFRHDDFLASIDLAIDASKAKDQDEGCKPLSVDAGVSV